MKEKREGGIGSMDGGRVGGEIEWMNEGIFDVYRARASLRK